MSEPACVGAPSKGSPRVSFVVPAFNVPQRVLTAALESVAAQTVEDFECIVVDESAEPDAARACRDLCERMPRFRYLRPDSRLGLAASLNFGIAQARGEWIARFDADDLCIPERLERQLAYLESHPDVEVLGSALSVMDNSGAMVATRRYPTDHVDIDRKMQWSNAMAHPTVMIRRTLFESRGGYNPAYRFSEDLELWLRWLNQGVRFANLSEALVCYRQESTRRAKANWTYNLRARRMHFTSRHLLRRVIGICGIAVWYRLPERFQERLFRALMFRNGVRPNE